MSSPTLPTALSDLARQYELAEDVAAIASNSRARSFGIVSHRCHTLVSTSLGTALLLLLTAGCASFNQPPFSAQQKKAATGWSIQYSPSMPSGPTVGGPGSWYFDFPLTRTIRRAFPTLTSTASP